MASENKSGAPPAVMDFVARVDAEAHGWLNAKFREFCRNRKKMTEPSPQGYPDILSACEDPQNLGEYVFADGLKYPLRQTNQMALEDELLTHPQTSGCFCQTTSYRFEQNPVPGRHYRTFPMLEFELPGDFDALLQFERELLEHLGFGKAASFPTVTYQDACKRYGVQELTHAHEAKMATDYGPVVFLVDFPEHTSPFFNMKRSKEGLAKKCDVIMYGAETIGSAERGCDAEEMRRCFYSISGGTYAKTLFERFGKDRVEKELNQFLSHKFITRSGGGIGVTRLLSACQAAKIGPFAPGK